VIPVRKLKATFTGQHVKGSILLGELFISLSRMLFFPMIPILGLFVAPFRLLKK
jgi:hypothetical protein